MKLDLDSNTITIPCPQCGKQLKEQIGRMKREKHITCQTCGRIAVNTDKIREIESRLSKQLTEQLAKLSKTINIKL